MSNDSPQNDPLPNDSISKCLKTLQILGDRGALRVSELSRELDVAASTAHRLLNILRIHEFAEQEPNSRRYLLGPAAVRLARNTRGDQGLVSTARPHLEWLSAGLDETVNLITLDGPDALFVDGVESRQPLRVATRTGARVPAYSTAGGKALLALLPPSSVRARYSGGLTRITEHTLVDLDALDIELEQVRECGYGCNLGEHLEDIFAIGVSVEGAAGLPIAALTVAVPATRSSRDRLVTLAPLLHEVSSRITTDLRSPTEGTDRRAILASLNESD